MARFEEDQMNDDMDDVVEFATDKSIGYSRKAFFKGVIERLKAWSSDDQEDEEVEEDE